MTTTTLLSNGKTITHKSVSRYRKLTPEWLSRNNTPDQILTSDDTVKDYSSFGAWTRISSNEEVMIATDNVQTASSWTTKTGVVFRIYRKIAGDWVLSQNIVTTFYLTKISVSGDGKTIFISHTTSLFTSCSSLSFWNIHI